MKFFTLAFFRIAICLICTGPISAIAQEASPSPTPKVTDNDRFIRVINLVEPRVTVIWKAGFDVLLEDDARSMDVRSHENTGFIAYSVQDFKKKWHLRSNHFPSASMDIAFADPTLEKSIFTTVFIMGTMKDGSQSVHATIVPDVLTAPAQALVRFVPAVQSYPVNVLINGKLQKLLPGTFDSGTYPPGKLAVTVNWKDDKNRDRKLDYEFLIESGKTYTLALVDTGEGKSNPTISMYNDSEMAKDAVESLAETRAAPTSSPTVSK